jgi:hypothetical protein
LSTPISLPSPWTVKAIFFDPHGSAIEK